MNALAAEQIELAEYLRAELTRVNSELAILRPPKRSRATAKKLPDVEVTKTHGPLLANGMFYSRGIDKFTGKAYDCCPTCGQRLRVTLDTRNGT